MVTRIRHEQIKSGAASNGDVLTADGAGNADWVAPGGAVIADHDHSGDAGDGGTFDAANLTSAAAGDGDVLTADGSGGAAWEAPAAGGGDVTGPAGATGDDIATYNGATGKVIKDGGKKISDLIADPATPEQGDILYWDGASWVRLAHGTNVQYLKSGGHGANPGWNTPAGAGDVVGPAGATDGHVALFDGATGKLIKDGGAPGAGSTDILMVQVFS